jgi:hypothetical protein
MSELKQDTRPVYMGTFLKNKSKNDQSLQEIDLRLNDLEKEISTLRWGIFLLSVLSIISFSLAII